MEEGTKAIFPKAVVQRCIVHRIRNSIKYVPSKDYKKFTQALKRVYGASNLKTAQTAFKSFQNKWSQYPGAVDCMKKEFCVCRIAVKSWKRCKKNHVYN